MKKIILFLTPITLFVSCKTNPDSNRNYSDRERVYKLQLNPSAGSSYYYEITNQSEIKVEVDDKKADNLNKSNIAMYYEFNKDSVGDLLLTITYDKIHLYTKNGGNETDIDADNSEATLNPMEKMLGALKKAKVTASINELGEIKNVNGYKEIGDKIIAGFNSNDPEVKTAAEAQWEKLAGEGIIKNNMEELFKIFPDSAVHIGDSWKLSSKETGETPLNVKNIFWLKAINDDITLIESEGIITGDSSSTSFTGFSNATADLKGKQQGEYEIETKTGLLISCKIRTKIDGTINAMDREIPVVIETSVKINGRKSNKMK